MGDNKKTRNKGTFIGFHVTEGERMEKLNAVERAFDEHFGDEGRNRARALRYIVDCFNVEYLKNFPKSPPPVSTKKQPVMMAN